MVPEAETAKRRKTEETGHSRRTRWKNVKTGRKHVKNWAKTSWKRLKRDTGGAGTPAAAEKWAFSLPRQQCTPPSQAEGQGSRAGVCSPGILGGAWRLPPARDGRGGDVFSYENTSPRVGFWPEITGPCQRSGRLGRMTFSLSRRVNGLVSKTRRLLWV